MVIKALLNCYRPEWLLSYSDMHMRRQISIWLHVMESFTLYGTNNTHKSPLGGPQHTLSGRLWAVVFMESRPADLRWFILTVLTFPGYWSSLTCADALSIRESSCLKIPVSMKSELVWSPSPRGNALKLRAVISHLIPVKKNPNILICSQLFSTFFLPNWVAEHWRQCRGEQTLRINSFAVPWLRK